MKRQIIFVDVFAAARVLASARDDLGIDVERRPRLLVDVHLHTGEVLQVKEVPSGSGWGSVPTPVF